MAPTHDYDISNQTAPSFRADLNNALQAIVSNNSGSTEPPVTFANMLWYDTANNLLRMRNEADEAFITLGTLDQVAGTFTAAVALASEAEAEAGTENTKLMTPLRVKQSIVQNAGAVTTQQVLSANADAAVGAIGTYAFLKFNSTTPPIVSPGGTVAGSNMQFQGAVSANFSGASGPAMSASGVTVVGTWRCMGNLQATSGLQTNNVTLYLRIS